MKKILIDIDDVIVKNVYLKAMNKVLGTSKKIEECKYYGIDNNFDNITPEQLRDYYKYVCGNDIYKDAELFADCKRVIKKLSQKYEVYICSAVVLGGNVEESGNIFVSKYNFLCKTFPFIDPNNFIFATDKKMFRADIIIDDKPSNMEGENKGMKLLFTAFHNRDLSKDMLDKLGLIRVENWKEIEKILL